MTPTELAELDLAGAKARIEALESMLRRARPFVDTNPDLYRAGGDELAYEIDAALPPGLDPLVSTETQ